MNKTVIIYASKHGTTERVARMLADKSSGNVDIISLKHDKISDMYQYDTFILGTPIYAGKPLKVMRVFCEQNMEILLQKTTALFICGMHPDADHRAAETMDAYPEWLYKKSKAIAFLGGEFIFEELNFFEKLIVRKVSNINGSVSAIDENAIAHFYEELIKEDNGMI